MMQVLCLQQLAGAGFEPATSGLWARRATRLLYPAIINIYIYCKKSFIQEEQKQITIFFESSRLLL